MAQHVQTDDPAGALRLAEGDATTRALADSADGEFDALADLFLGDAPHVDGLQHDGRLTPADAPCLVKSAARDDMPPLRLTSTKTPSDPSSDAKQAVRRAPSPRPTPQQKGFEALLLSHLPVTSGPWASQYAAAVAFSTRQAVALITLLPGRTSVRIFGSQHVKTNMPSSGGEISITQALQAACKHHPIWMLRTNALGETTLLEDENLSAVTVLTSADEAATVAAYRTLKGVRSLLSESRFDDECAVALRLGVVGAAPDRARAVASSINRAARTFLDCPIELGGITPTIGPTNGVALLDTDESMNPADALQRLRAVVAAADDQSTSAPPAREEASAMRVDDLAALIDSSLALIPARCPYERGVELAIDRNGALHMLMRKSPRAFESAAIVRAWAVDHVDMLELMSQRKILNATTARLHIFVESARDARSLVRAACSVHLLVSRTIQGEQVVFAVDL